MWTDRLVANPTIQELEQSDINLFVAGSKTGVVMVEGGGNEVPEADMLEAIFFAHDAMQPAIDMQTRLKEAVGVEKRTVLQKEKDAVLVAKLEETAPARFREVLDVDDKIKRQVAHRTAMNDIMERLGEEYADRTGEAAAILDEIYKRVSRDLILKEGKRIGGRRFDEVRPITCEVGFLPRPHGSALFTPG